MHRIALHACALAGFGWGCSATIPEGIFLCTATGDCPAGWTCDAGLCRSVEQPRDAGRPGDAALPTGDPRPAGDANRGDTNAGDSNMGDTRPSCIDARFNQDETDVDCGGSCQPCSVGQVCVIDADCITDQCIGGRCAGPEDCTDGIDNDMDTDIDCADSDCAVGFVCVPPVPGAWQSYVEVANIPYAPAAMPLPCAGTRTRRLSDPSPATCGGCQCDDIMGVQCAPTPLLCDLNPTSPGDCGAATEVTSSGNLSCIQPAGANENMSCVTGGPLIVSTGTCGPKGGGLTQPQPWGSRTESCDVGGIAGGGCAGTSICKNRQAPSYQTLCIHRDGVHSCPAGFADRYVTFNGGTDTRACSACTCSANPTCAAGAFRYYHNTSCGGLGSPIGSACVHTGNESDDGQVSLRFDTPSVPGGSCSSGGGQASGQVTTNGPRTYCCP